MRKLALLIFVICLVPLAVLTAKSFAASPPLTVYVVDQSAGTTTSKLENALPAFQAAVSKDFAPVWGVDAQLVLTRTPPAGGWAIYIQDDSDQAGALGYHDKTADRVPYARVFARDSAYYGVSWQSVFTHELFEMLADPFIENFAQGWHLWLIEVADPVEDSQFNYTRTGANGSRVQISDFVTPAWYQRISKRGPYDFGRHVKRKGQILSGGYASYLVGDAWHFIFQY